MQVQHVCAHIWKTCLGNIEQQKDMSYSRLTAKIETKMFDCLKSIKFQAFTSLRDQKTELGESVSFPLLLVGWANIVNLSGVLPGFSNGNALGVPKHYEYDDVVAGEEMKRSLASVMEP